VKSLKRRSELFTVAETPKRAEEILDPKSQSCRNHYYTGTEFGIIMTFQKLFSLTALT